MASLPDLVRRPGDIVGAPPYRAEDCVMQAMLLKGDRGKQQAHVDQVLNRPADGAYAFHVLSDWLLLNAVYVETMRSLDPIDGPKGVMREVDIGFWTAVRGGPVDRLDRWKVYWLPSFLYVDTASAMASGREIYGYPKTASRIVRTASSSSDPTVEVWALHMPRYGPTERPVEECLLRISKPTTPADDSGLEAEIAWAWGTLNIETPTFEGRAAPPSSAVMSQIMLRQFRDPFTLGRASVQEGLVAEPRALKVRGLGVLSGGAEVQITASKSHPVMETLGVTATAPARGLWLAQDFELGAARPLWRQP